MSGVQGWYSDENHKREYPLWNASVPQGKEDTECHCLNAAVFLIHEYTQEHWYQNKEKSLEEKCLCLTHNHIQQLRSAVKCLISSAAIRIGIF